LIVDVHAHYYPQEFLDKLVEFYPGDVEVREGADGKPMTVAWGMPMHAWNREQRIGEMDAAGVDIEVLSIPRLYMGMDHNTPELCRLANDACSAACVSSKRFRMFASLPFNNVEAALAELQRVRNLPGVAGVLVTSNLGGRYIAEAQFLPFWAEVARYNIPVFCHPLPPPGAPDDDPLPVVAFPTDTTNCLMKLLYSGLYETYPDLVIIAPHLGGTLPYLARRIDLSYEYYDAAKYRRIPRPPSEYMHKLYFDTALSWHKPSFECARALVGIDHIVYGSDHGFRHPSDLMQRVNTFVESMDLSKGDKAKIYHLNAERILKL
jgi:predicted TIM-barrel fold metal-dependent hydrolase